MMKSMTGFGRYEVSEGDRKITVEMKSVNHRYLDVSMKMPKKLNFLIQPSVEFSKAMFREEKWMFL